MKRLKTRFFGHQSTSFETPIRSKLLDQKLKKEVDLLQRPITLNLVPDTPA
jgi:hypothetical protein